jgi:alkylated DNA repair dioxygenase AlkB
MLASGVQRQLDLFAVGAPSFDGGFRAIRRIELAHGAWIEHARGWVSGHDRLFDQLEHTVPWRAETMRMYDRDVAVPRLLGSFREIGVPPLLEDMRLALGARYGEEFVRVTAALYRDGKDSVASHGDTTARDMVQALVATVSLGAPRRMLLRPSDGGQAIPFELGGGDLFVMGGTAQRTWRHGIPKVAKAGPRIAVMFRPRWGETY